MRSLKILSFVAIAALLASCSQQVAPIVSQQPIGNIDAYFWWSGETPMPMADTPGTIPSTSTLTFLNNSNGLLGVTDGSHTNIQCVVNQDSIFAEGFTQASIVALSNGSYLSASDSEYYKPQPPSTIVTTDGTTRQVIVGTDSGVFFYNSASGYSFQQSGQLQDSNITALTVMNSGTPRVLAATPWGNIMSTTPPLSTNSSWTLYLSVPQQATIQQLLWTGGDTIFAILAGKSGVWESYSSLGWKQLSYLNGYTISALGQYRTSGGALYLLVGTMDGQIGAFPLTSGLTAVSPVSTGAGEIYCFGGQSSSEIAVAGTYDGIYQWTGPSNNTWISSPTFTNFKQVISINLESDNIVFVSTSNAVNTVESGSFSTGTLTQLKPAHSPLQVGSYSSLPWILTTQDYEAPKSQGGSLVAVAGFSPGAWQPDTGGLVLMRDNLFANDSSWRAGTLVTANHQPFAITARVLSHLDSLHISGISKSFPDVLMIRYANEGADQQPGTGTVPYWIIYFAKNEGPVMFDNIGAQGSPNSFERWAIKP